MTTPFDLTISRTRACCLFVLGVILAATIAIAPVVSAQTGTPDPSPEASPEASPAAETAPEQDPVTVSTLFESDLDRFPTAPISVRLLRITLAPGASSPLHIHPGPEFDLVESGTLSIEADGDATMTQDGDPEPVPGDGADLTEGQYVVFPAGTGMSLVNGTESDVVILSAVFHPVNENTASTTYPDGEPESDAFEGVSFDVLGDGIVLDYPEGATSVSLEQVEVPAGTDLPSSDGASLYSVIDGNFSFTVDSGDVQVSRSSSPGLRPNAAPGQEFTLETGDAAFFPNGVEAITRADEPDTLGFYRLTATPADNLAADPAALTFRAAAADEQPDAAAANETSDGTSAASTEIEVGAIVVTNTDTVNLRAEPSVDADGIDQLAAGIELEIIGGPEDADDFTWWQVQVVDSGVEGWVVEDFIAIEGAGETPAASADQTPEADAAETPEADPTGTPAADAAPLADGDAVVTNDENVRLRDAAGPEGAIINAYPADTEFTVTGEPEEVDGTTWYPVSLVEDDSISGWIAEEFLDPAP